jgi:predicted nucleotidyltransferase
MMSESLPEKITAVLVERFRPRRVILFGSHARGDSSPESDIDLFVELDDDLGKRPLERAVAVRSAFGLHPWPMDLLVYTTDEIRRMRRTEGTILSVVEAEGKVLYERS